MQKKNYHKINLRNVGADWDPIRLENNKGITLIALIITIIVMLILVAVTVRTVVNSGLFKHAKDATEKWADAQENEKNIGNGPITIGGVTYNSIDEYLESLPNNSEDPETPEIPDRTGLSVGDYVAYTPDTAGNYMGLGTSESEKAGSTSNSASGIPQDTTLVWRILSINEDGSVDIVSENPTSQAVFFKGSIGFNNGVYLLNDLCASLYSNSTLGVTARSMNLEDIEKKINSFGINDRNAYTFDEIQYGNTKIYSGSCSYSPDIYDYVGKTTTEESKDYYTTPTTNTHTKKGTLTVQQTYYTFSSTSTSYFDDAIFNELIFGTDTGYWLASRYSVCRSSIASFGLRSVSNDNLFRWQFVRFI